MGLFRVLDNVSPTYWRIVFAIGLVSIATLSLLPAGVATPAFPHSDKVAHLIAYAGLSMTGALSYRGRVVILIFALISYGALIEYLQSYVPTREMEILDLVANTGGIFCGVLIAKCFISRSGQNAYRRIKDPDFP